MSTIERGGQFTSTMVYRYAHFEKVSPEEFEGLASFEVKWSSPDCDPIGDLALAQKYIMQSWGVRCRVLEMNAKDLYYLVSNKAFHVIERTLLRGNGDPEDRAQVVLQRCLNIEQVDMYYKNSWSRNAGGEEQAKPYLPPGTILLRYPVRW